MNRFYLICIVIIFSISCDENDQLSVHEEIYNEMTINVDGIEYNVLNENIGGNENCDKLYLSTYYYENDKIQYRLKFDLSMTGEILHVWYDEYNLQEESPRLNKIFLAPNFNPTRTFNVSNFDYNYDTGRLRFDFEGTLFWERDNSVTRNVSGSIDIDSFDTINCNVAKLGISYYSDSFKLHSYHGTQTKHYNGNQTHRFFSNNGYILDIKIDEDLWNKPENIIQFDENSNINNVRFLKQNGEIVANQSPALDQFNWTEFETNGRIFIIDKIIENNQKLVAGYIEMEASVDGEIIYFLENIEFRTSSFVE